MSKESNTDSEFLKSLKGNKDIPQDVLEKAEKRAQSYIDRYFESEEFNKTLEEATHELNIAIANLKSTTLAERETDTHLTVAASRIFSDGVLVRRTPVNGLMIHGYTTLLVDQDGFDFLESYLQTSKGDITDVLETKVILLTEEEEPRVYTIVERRMIPQTYLENDEFAYIDPLKEFSLEKGDRDIVIKTKTIVIARDIDSYLYMFYGYRQSSHAIIDTMLKAARSPMFGLELVLLTNPDIGIDSKGIVFESIEFNAVSERDRNSLDYEATAMEDSLIADNNKLILDSIIESQAGYQGALKIVPMLIDKGIVHIETILDSGVSVRLIIVGRTCSLETSLFTYDCELPRSSPFIPNILMRLVKLYEKDHFEIETAREGKLKIG